ncbi:ATP-dependent helicase C23E6.02 [Apiospora aurea]|uniref:ATP-dependent helicase C23E6.02 n=1 Tax=Apiospora aurea TaxID=335848 RepID=A0ABR1PY02_9PEZI
MSFQSGDDPYLASFNDGPLKSSSDLKRPPSPISTTDQADGSKISRLEPGADTPLEMSCDLMPHQRLGLEWLMELEKDYGGSILADDLGLGKTIQALALILSRPAARRSQSKTTLIAVPLSLLKQWEDEFEMKVEPKMLDILIYHGPQQKKNMRWEKLKYYDVVLTTYDMLSGELRKKRSTESSRDLNLLSPDSHFHRVILDEAQLIKDPCTDRSRAATELKADFRLCLTGTPIMNSIDELYALVQFLRIEPYNDQDVFDEEIGAPLREELSAKKDDAAPKRQRKEQERDTRNAESALAKVHELLDNIMLRRTKTDRVLGQPIVDLPERIEVDRPVTFSKEERDMYDTLEGNEDKSIWPKKGAALVKTMRLRQLCLHPDLLPDALQDRNLEPGRSSSKVDSALKLLESIWKADERAKVIVFSGFTAFLDKFYDLLIAGGFTKMTGINIQRYDGKTNVKARDDALKYFRERAKLLLMSTKAGSMGLNIAWATHVLLMEPEYIPYVEEQAIGRAHRVGQERVLTVYHLFVEGTVEERIRKMQNDKKEHVRLVLGDEEAPSDEETSSDSDEVSEV